MGGDHFRLFISHTSAKKREAGQIRQWMGYYGVDGFVAHTTIEPTTEWIHAIEAALRSCHALVAMLTEDFPQSRWCDQEVGLCVGRRILIVPVRMGIDPYGFIGRYQGLTPRPNLAGLPEQLFDLLAANPVTRSQMVDPVIRRFARSGSFDGTRAAWPSIQALPAEAWTEDRVRTVREAARENSQIKHANLRGVGTPVPEALDTLLRGHGVAPEGDDIVF